MAQSEPSSGHCQLRCADMQVWTVIGYGKEKSEARFQSLLRLVVSSWRGEGKVVPSWWPLVLLLPRSAADADVDAVVAAAAVSGLEAPRWMLLRPPPA